MRAWRWLMLGIVGVVAGAANVQAGSGWTIGGGANYWVSVDDIDVDEIDDDGLGYFISLQNKSDIIGYGVDVEALPDRFGEDAYAPQIYLTLGNTIYAGAGAGWVNLDGDWADDPFYAFRAGLDLGLLGPVHLDVYGQYRFESSQELEDNGTDIDTDTVFIGAAARIEL